MASSTPNSKRRCLEQAATALSRPFKSPLRKSTPIVKEEATSPKIEEISSFQTTISAEKPTHTPLPFPTPPPTRKRTHLRQRIAPARKPALSDPAIITLQKQQRELQSRLSSLRSELDTVQQALRIESSNRDDELEALIVKWKKVSQDAAEEVFSGAQERISRMGGVKAWRERMKNDHARWEREGMEPSFGNVDARGLDLDEVEGRDRNTTMRDEIGKENAKEHDDEPEEFTMDMLLKTMNIDLTSIGFDKPNQIWITR